MIPWIFSFGELHDVVYFHDIMSSLSVSVKIDHPFLSPLLVFMV